MDRDRVRRPKPDASTDAPAPVAPAEVVTPSPSRGSPVWARNPHEHSADSLAATAMHTEKEPTLDRRPLSPPQAPAEVDNAARPLPARVRAEFEARFG